MLPVLPTATERYPDDRGLRPRPTMGYQVQWLRWRCILYGRAGGLAGFFIHFRKACMTASDTTSELEKLVSDLRGLLANKNLDAVPEIKLLRQRLDDGMHQVRDSAVRAAQDAARQAKDAALAADRYAHDEPWRVAGAALAAGAVVGFLLARR